MKKVLFIFLFSRIFSVFSMPDPLPLDADEGCRWVNSISPKIVELILNLARFEKHTHEEFSETLSATQENNTQFNLAAGQILLYLEEGWKQFYIAKNISKDKPFMFISREQLLRSYQKHNTKVQHKKEACQVYGLTRADSLSREKKTADTVIKNVKEDLHEIFNLFGQEVGFPEGEDQNSIKEKIKKNAEELTNMLAFFRSAKTEDNDQTLIEKKEDDWEKEKNDCIKYGKEKISVKLSSEYKPPKGTMNVFGALKPLQKKVDDNVFMHSEQYLFWHLNKNMEDILSEIQQEINPDSVKSVIFHLHTTQDMCKTCCVSAALEHMLENKLMHKLRETFRKSGSQNLIVSSRIPYSERGKGSSRSKGYDPKEKEILYSKINDSSYLTPRLISFSDKNLVMLYAIPEWELDPINLVRPPAIEVSAATHDDETQEYSLFDSSSSEESSVTVTTV